MRNPVPLLSGREDNIGGKVARFKFDNKKSSKLKADPRRLIDFIEIQEIWSHPHYIDYRSDDPVQFRAIGWVKGMLYSVIYEVRDDRDGEYYHLVTLWKSTKQEERLYDEYR
ncbi:MAG: hypothetical protein WCP96_02000 [Methylococcaceae bacterium]